MNLSFDFAVLPLEPTGHSAPPIQDPRALALGYVRKLLERGYTEKNAAEEFEMGDCGKGAWSGYVIRRGKIFVPRFGPTRYEFRFKDLAYEIRTDTSSAEPT